MNTMKTIALAISIAFSTGAMAQSMTKDEYKAAKSAAAATAKSARASCGSLAGNAKDICKAQTSGDAKVARAELEASYKPSDKSRYDVRVARANADYSVAKEKCDDAAGNVKDVCVKEAKAIAVAAKADAKVQKKGGDARKDAATDKRNADYAVALEKCDAFASNAKTDCVKAAKTRFGKT